MTASQTERMASLGKLVSGAAYELNNPLTGIIGYSQLLLTRGLTETQMIEARKIRLGADRALGIVRNLLLFSRGEHPKRVTVPLEEIIKCTLSLRSHEMELEGIAVKAELGSGSSLILTNPDQLQQAILNLLVNAEDSIPEGVGEGCIWIRTTRLPENRIRVEIEDDGPGIPDSNLGNNILDTRGVAA